MHENEIARSVIGAAIAVHKNLGPGLLESTYEAALAYDLRILGFDVKQQHPLPFKYKEVRLSMGFRVDLLINKKVIIEIKSVEALAPVHFAQLLTYLRLSDLRLGLLFNFNVLLLKEAIHRVVNRL
ncbi:MAG: GxxExxY protein [Saprospiraceae bacterium]|nr:GxxExxY protein [Saprospiraceae bacterium]